MLSKRANITSKEIDPVVTPQPKRIRIEKEIVFIPSIKRDMIRNVYIFLREVNSSEAPFQITVTLHDYSLGRLGYYDLSYKNLANAKKQFEDIIRVLEEVREDMEYNMLPCHDMEKICRKSIDAVLQHAAVCDSSYHGKSRGREAAEI